MFTYRKSVIRLIVVAGLVATLLSASAFQNIIPAIASAGDTNSISVAMKHTKNVTLVAVKNNGDEPIYGFMIKFTEGSIKFAKAKGWDRQRVDTNGIMLRTDDKPITSGMTLLVILIVDNKNSGLEWVAINKDAVKFAASDTRSELKESSIGSGTDKPHTEFKGMNYTITGSANCYVDGAFVSCDVLDETKPLPKIKTPTQLRVTWEATPSGEKPVFFNWEFGIIRYDANTGALTMFSKCLDCYGVDSNVLRGSQIVTVTENLAPEESPVDPFTGEQAKFKPYFGIQVNTNIEKWTINVKELPPIGSPDNPTNSHLNIRIGIKDSFWITYIKGHESVNLNTVKIGASVKDNDGHEVSDATINAIITSPSENAVEKLTRTTNISGSTGFSWKIPDDAEVGIYTVTITAMKEDSGSGTYSKSFEIISKEYCQSLGMKEC